MARYFFDVINGTGLTKDEEGQDLPSLAAARDVAINGARALMRDEVATGFIDFSARIEVKDRNRQAVVTISFREAVEPRGLDGLSSHD